MTSTPFVLLLQAAAPGGASAWMPLLFQFAAIAAIFYFLVVRPQQRARKAHEERLTALKKGDQVVTNGGIVGEVVHIKETTPGGGPRAALADHVTIRSGESRLVVERGRIASVNGAAAPIDPRRNAAGQA